MATVGFESQCRDGFDEDDGCFSGAFAPDRGRGASGMLSDDPLTHTSRPRVARRVARPDKDLHRIAAVREQQGVTQRNVARRLGMELAVVRRQEQPDCDLRISDLMLWQQVLEVPIAELLVEGEGQLSGPVLARSRMVKLMKTAAAIREQSGSGALGKLADMLITQILEIMPELADVTPWHSVGQRRTLAELGRTACQVVSEDSLRSGGS